MNDDANDGAELNNATSRESKSLVSRRGSQPRRGSTAEVLSDVQKYWGDDKSGKNKDGDEGMDEDEDPDGTPTGN